MIKQKPLDTGFVHCLTAYLSTIDIYLYLFESISMISTRCAFVACGECSVIVQCNCVIV